MTERGIPVRLSRSELADTEQEIRDIITELDGPGPEIPLLVPPDHVLESRGDCVITFLEEGLLPLVRDVINPTTDDVLEIAEDIMDEFRSKHPNDFDMDNPLNLISIAQIRLLPLTIMYAVKSKRSIEDGKTFILINQAGDLLQKVTDEFFPDDGNDDEEDI